MPNKICYVTFESNPTKEYAYFCGALTPEPGGFVVILVGGDRDKKKIVKCSRISSDPDPPRYGFAFRRCRPTTRSIGAINAP